MKLSHIILFVFALGISVPSFAKKAAKSAEGLEWYTDLAKAHEKSKATHRPIFGFFTGSDWCGWCHKLQNEVFSKPAFIKWAKEKVVLLELDFPRQKQLPQELQQQNASLQQAFRVQGYPTVWLFFTEQDPETKKLNISALGSTGYPQGATAGKEEVKFLADANAILAKAPAASTGKAKK
jgi:thiol-disulfide isomerase/thioredoxin